MIRDGARALSGWRVFLWRLCGWTKGVADARVFEGEEKGPDLWSVDSLRQKGRRRTEFGVVGNFWVTCIWGGGDLVGLSVDRKDCKRKITHLSGLFLKAEN